MFMGKLRTTIQAKKEKKNDCFNDMIADIMTNKKFQTIIKELFIISRNVINSLVFSRNLVFLFKKMFD